MRYGIAFSGKDCRRGEPLGGEIVTIHIEDDLDLDRIAESGQCFRWEKTGAQAYRVIAGKTCLYIAALGDGRFELDCTEEEYRDRWRDYFDLTESYRGIRERIDKGLDPFLWEAAKAEQGIRILRQDPWETLISFIISQNRNIPAIRRSIAMLSESCGEKHLDSRGREYYAFPDPETIAELPDEALTACKLGYRSKYVHAAAAAVANGEIDLESLLFSDEETTIKALTGLYGVGVKVANCVSLYGLHHINAFPVDVWVKRILSEQYPAGYPFERYSPYNGIYQQYMFAYYRNK